MSGSVFERDEWRITSPYGYRIHPITGEYGWHAGIDLAQTHQHPIPAWVGGKVLHAGWGQIGSGIGGYGYVVIIQDHRNHLHLYCHLDSVDVFSEEQVNAGQIVGRQGTTGISTASHLHYEVRTKTKPYFGWQTDTNPGEYLEAMLMDEQPAEWKLAAVDALADRGILNNPDKWKEWIDDSLPAWAVFVIAVRLAESDQCQHISRTEFELLAAQVAVVDEKLSTLIEHLYQTSRELKEE